MKLTLKQWILILSFGVVSSAVISLIYGSILYLFVLTNNEYVVITGLVILVVWSIIDFIKFKTIFRLLEYITKKLKISRIW